MTYTKQTYEIKSSQKPHYFIGSKIRGTLGYALREEVCINPTLKHKSTCEGCWNVNDCIFYKFYEQQNIIHNYRLDFKLNSQKYKFSILLFEDAIKYKEEIKKATLKSLNQYKDIDYKEKTKTLKTKKHNSIIRLEFITPLRIKKNNTFATKDIDLQDILVSIHKRDLGLKKEPFKPIEINKDVKLISKNIRYQNIIRKSNKQNKKMNLGGLMGEIIISGVDKHTYNLLKLGEVIGVGKSTVFGLGKIKIEDIK